MNEKTIFIYENTIGKITFSYSTAFWLEEIDGVSNIDISISESKGIGQIGASVVEQSVEPRILSIDGLIFEPIESNRKQLLSVFSPQVPSTLTVIENGESWYLDVLPRKTPLLSSGNVRQAFQIELYAAYPYWRSTGSYEKQVAGLIGLFRFPFYTGGTWWISKYSDNYFYTIKNKGNVPIEFKVIFTARSELTNPELYHMDTQKRIALRKTLLAGEKLIVSTVYGERGVVFVDRNGVSSNGFKYLTVDSALDMKIIPNDNLLRVDAQTNREGLSVRIQAPEGVVSGV